MRYKLGYKKTKIHPYKSTLEYKLAKELSGYTYEPPEIKVAYSVHHSYVPDFVHPDSTDILLEAKGYFIKGHSDCQKYLAVVRDNPDKELIFIFSDPNKKAYPQCRVRKDGTFLTLGDWCRQNNILCFKVGEIPEDLIRGAWGVEDARRFKEGLYGC